MCEILPADYDGDGCPDGAEGCSPFDEDFTNALEGWFYDATDPECRHGELRFSDSRITRIQSRIRFECLQSRGDA